MSKKLEPCPFCGGEARIIVCDDEGNHHSDDYEDDPWSGLGFMLYHDEENNPECPIAHDIYSECGRAIYDTREEAIAAWNRCAETESNDPLTLERFEAICEAVHNGWWKEKINQGVTGHPDMIPYADLAENIKDYDRVTVCRVLEALGIAYRRPPEGDDR
ncbi:hypothetical protein LI291_10580 [Intestinibacillus massiliensis]|nr:hypothetical protein [Intestinibacillus massiliensis]